jgi:glycosyltransferase involved in cell wall biosynthesis
LCGKAVIAGDSGGVSDAVINNQTGLLVDPEKIEEILLGEATLPIQIKVLEAARLIQILV